jgi:hypothetical protein
MFADNRDYTAGQVKLRVRGFATLSHKYSTGALEWKRWTPLPEAQEYVDIDPPEGQYPLPNALVIYGGIKWDDVKEQARDQRKALKDPEDPAHDPLMKAVLDALTTQQ